MAWHIVRDEWGGVFWLVEKTTRQSGSFNWMNNNLYKRCQVVWLPVSQKLLKKPGLSLYICTCYLDVAMHYLDLTKGVG